ncbi:MAG: transcription antitermination factor NusB [Thermodesulfobacteriota bacterium]|nr:MAG: transcription antitermination factor NusB [Thermodesulfobacteriota bacterium]
MGTKVTSRHRSREKALHLLYRLDISEGETTGGTAPLEEEDYGAALAAGVTAHGAEIDKLIEDFCENWSVDRMAVVDRNILRLAVFELLYRREVPYKVVIDEAVELANRYCSEDSGAFINGVLDRIFKDFITKKKPLKV